MKSSWPVLACAAVLAGGCAKGSREGETPKFSRTGNIKVTKAGEVFYDRKRVSVDELARELGALPKEDSAVCYYREEADQEPHPVVLEVMEKVTETGLPVLLSEKECR